MQTEVILIDKDALMVNYDYVKNQLDADGNHPPPSGLSHEQLEQLGYRRITISEKPDDFSDETYYRTEQPEYPYVIYKKKPDEQINQALNGRIKAQISTLEDQQGRAIREAVLTGDTTRLKALDDQIVALRSQLK